ncbi:unnamed protein product [Porites lobata]|uniref:Uncharacterized protein n=1 Tax=Porites lobata TaxID=104759 RepID=A0ABN8Q344_9CNID|nr:unnamed protein product [Porites lobata]
MAVEIRKLSTVLFFVACAIFVPQESGGILLDPTLIGRELQSFANDALGVDDLQTYFNQLQYQTKKLEGNTADLSVNLRNKFQTRFAVTKRLKDKVEAL